MKPTILILLLAGCGENKTNSLNVLPETISRTERGDRGEKGEKGDTGSIGTQGATGSQGATGASAHKSNVFDQNNVLIGELYGVNSTTNLYYVANSNNDRFEIDQTWGTVPSAYILYSGLNCTGTKRLMLPNGKFANVYIDASSNTLVRMTGRDQGLFNYQSRIPAGNSCQNATNSALNSYVSSDYTATFVYPMGRLGVEN